MTNQFVSFFSALLLLLIVIGCAKDDGNSNFAGQSKEDLLLKERWIDGQLKNSYDYYEDLRPKTQTYYDEFGEIGASYQYYYLSDTIYLYRFAIISADSGLVGKWYPVLDNMVREESYTSLGLYKYNLNTISTEGCGREVRQYFEADSEFITVDSITYDGAYCSGFKNRYFDGGYFFDKTVWLAEEGNHYNKSMEISLFGAVNNGNIISSQVFGQNDELLYWMERNNTYNSSNYPTSIYEIDSDSLETLYEFTYY